MIDRENVIKELKALHLVLEKGLQRYNGIIGKLGCKSGMKYVDDALAILNEQEAVVHPEPSCEMTYITDCCCDLCGVQLIREDNFCRCCGKRIEWECR